MHAERLEKGCSSPTREGRSAAEPISTLSMGRGCVYVSPGPSARLGARCHVDVCKGGQLSEGRRRTGSVDNVVCPPRAHQCVVLRLVRKGRGLSYPKAHVLHPPHPPPRAQLCTSSCRNTHPYDMGPSGQAASVGPPAGMSLGGGDDGAAMQRTSAHAPALLADALSSLAFPGPSPP